MDRAQACTDPEPIHIEETDANFSIAWKGRYRIQGAAFVYVDRKTGGTRTILGYPTRQLEHARRGSSVVAGCAALNVAYLVGETKWKHIVLTYISRQALMDYFSAPGDAHITLQQWNLVVDRNLDALKRIIEEKYERGYWMLYNAYGQTYPRLVITLHDMRASGQAFTMDVLNLDSGFRRTV